MRAQGMYSVKRKRSLFTKSKSREPGQAVECVCDLRPTGGARSCMSFAGRNNVSHKIDSTSSSFGAAGRCAILRQGIPRVNKVNPSLVRAQPLVSFTPLTLGSLMTEQ